MTHNIIHIDKFIIDFFVYKKCIHFEVETYIKVKSARTIYWNSKIRCKTYHIIVYFQVTF